MGSSDADMNRILSRSSIAGEPPPPLPPNPPPPTNRLLTADQLAPLLTLMEAHNAPKVRQIKGWGLFDRCAAAGARGTTS